MALVKTGLFMLLLAAFIVIVLFGCAGRVDLPFFWTWVAVLLVAVLIIPSQMDPGLRAERRQPGKGGTDRHLRFIVLPFWLIHVVIAGLDVGRFHWSNNVPVAMQVAGLVGSLASYLLTAWAIRVNRFYSPVVRIQSDRGHVLVTDGPYRRVRHPGYAALLFNMVCGGLLLGSWWSLAPGAAVILLVLRRTIIEDRFLHENLAGYREYAARVRSRLIPGLW